MIPRPPIGVAIDDAIARGNDERSTLLPRVALEMGPTVAPAQPAEGRSPDERTDGRGDASPPSGRAVGGARRVRENERTGRRETELHVEGTREVRRAVPHEGDGSPGTGQLGEVRPHLGRERAAGDSAEVPDEEEHSRAVAPQIAQPERRAARVEDPQLG